MADDKNKDNNNPSDEDIQVNDNNTPTDEDIQPFEDISDNEDTSDIEDTSDSEEITNPDKVLGKQSVPVPSMPGAVGPKNEVELEKADSLKYLRFHTSSGTMPNEATKDYTKRKITVDNLINEFQQLYTITCFKRSTPNNMLLPNSFLKLLLGVNNLCKGKQATRAVDASVILGYVREPRGGNMKVSNSIWYDLCRMTADPFPLVVSEKDKDEIGDFIPTPLYSLSNGFTSAERYSRVGLSRLGQIACGEYYANKNTNEIKQLKTIVPLALLRKIMPWSLGHHSVSLGYNPSELFKLQAKMIERYGENPTNPCPWLLPDEDVQEIFKGVDVGDGYEGYMKNRSLMSMYHLGKGSVTIVPKITIDREHKTIIIERPPIGSISVDTADYLNCRMIGKDAITGKIYPKFETFQPKQKAVVANLQIIFDDVEFYATNQEVLNELQADDFIRVTVATTNTLLVDAEENRNEYLDQKLRDLDIQDSALDDFLVDAMPIHELLWRHVVWEYEKRYEIYEDRLRKAREDLEVDLFLEKVTRPKVAAAIQPLVKLKRDQRKSELVKMFQAEGTRDKKLLPEGFVQWEIDEICRVNTRDSRTGLVIWNIINDRNLYENRWKASQQKIDELMDILENPGRIYSEIKRDLDEWGDEPGFQRKTKMYFVDTIQVEKRGIHYDFNYAPDTYDKSYLPCTLYYSNNKILRSYGRNINFIPQKEEDMKVQYSYALNTTNWDKVYLFTRQNVTLHNVLDFPCYPINKNGLLGIIPYSEESDIMVVLSSDINGMETKQSQYFIIPKGTKRIDMSFATNVSIRCWCYLDRKYVEILSNNPKMKRFLYGLLPTEEIPRTPLKLGLLPFHIGVPLDIQGTDTVGGAIGLWSSRDYESLPAKSVPIMSWDSKKSATYTVLPDSQYKPYFTQHLEIYANNTYMHDWKLISAAHLESFTHGKKSVIDELIWCRPDDNVSKHINRLILNDLTTLKPSLHAIFSHCSESYDTYSIAQLDDWSLINPRYKLPTVRPEIDEVLLTYDEYLNEMFTCRVSDTSFKKTIKKLKEARNIILENTDMNPFTYDNGINVPTGLEVNTVDMDDDEDPDGYGGDVEE